MCIKLYVHHGFKICTINADPQFKPLWEKLPDQVFNFCAQDKHIPEIEHYVHAVKDQVCSCYNMLPFERVPHFMVIWLIGNAIFWLNAFPLKDVASSTLSPKYIMSRQHLNANKHIQTEFGAYVQTCEKHHKWHLTMGHWSHLPWTFWQQAGRSLFHVPDDWSAPTSWSLDGVAHASWCHWLG
jgi:hypothetical protein